MKYYCKKGAELKTESFSFITCFANIYEVYTFDAK